MNTEKPSISEETNVHPDWITALLDNLQLSSDARSVALELIAKGDSSLIEGCQLLSKSQMKTILDEMQSRCTPKPGDGKEWVSKLLDKIRIDESEVRRELTELIMSGDAEKIEKNGELSKNDVKVILGEMKDRGVILKQDTNWISALLVEIKLNAPEQRQELTDLIQQGDCGKIEMLDYIRKKHLPLILEEIRKRGIIKREDPFIWIAQLLDTLKLVTPAIRSEITELIKLGHHKKVRARDDFTEVQKAQIVEAMISKDLIKKDDPDRWVYDLLESTRVREAEVRNRVASFIENGDIVKIEADDDLTREQARVLINEIKQRSKAKTSPSSLLDPVFDHFRIRRETLNQDIYSLLQLGNREAIRDLPTLTPEDKVVMQKIMHSLNVCTAVHIPEDALKADLIIAITNQNQQFIKKHPGLSDKMKDSLLKAIEDPRERREFLKTISLSIPLGLSAFFFQQISQKAHDILLESFMEYNLNETRFPLEQYCLYTFSHIARRRDLKYMLSSLNLHYEKRYPNQSRLPVQSVSDLLLFVLMNSSEELKVQLLLILSYNYPIPLFLMDSSLNSVFLQEIYWIFKPMPIIGCLVFDAEDVAITNELFGTRFERRSDIKFGYEADIQFDYNFMGPGRGFAVARIGQDVPEDSLSKLLALISLTVVVVDYSKLPEYANKARSFLEEFASMKSDSTSMGMMILHNAPDSPLTNEDIQKDYGLKLQKSTYLKVIPSGRREDKLRFQDQIIPDIIKAVNDCIPVVLSDWSRIFNLSTYQRDEAIIEEFLDCCRKFGENVYSPKFLPIYTRYKQFVKTQTQISSCKGRDKLADLVEMVDKEKREMANPEIVHPSNILKIFATILTNPRAFILQVAISSRLKADVEERTKGDRLCEQDLNRKYQQIRSKNTEEVSQLKADLALIAKRLDAQMFSLEIIWRELVRFYCFQDTQFLASLGLTEQKQERLVSKYTANGQPFEVIDGDTITMPTSFLSNALISPHKRLLVISILGPQSSGKSTLLNYLFGCQLATAAGRCTKGIYGTLFDCSLGPYDGLLVLDSEGLFSTEKQDPEYDKKIVFFCFSVSHIVIINVRGIILTDMEGALGITLNALKQLNMNHVPAPTMFIVLNQTANLNVQDYMDNFNAIINQLNEKIQLHTLVSISEKNLKSLPSAFHDVDVFQSSDRRIRWKYLAPADQFGGYCEELRDSLIEIAIQTFSVNAATFATMKAWTRLAHENWEAILQYGDFMHLKQLQELNQTALLHAGVKELVRTTFESEESKKSRTVVINELKKFEQQEAEYRLAEHWNQQLTPLVEKGFQKLHNEIKPTEHVYDLAKYQLNSTVSLYRQCWESILKGYFAGVRLISDAVSGRKEIKQKIQELLGSGRKFSKDEALMEFTKLWDSLTEKLANSINEHSFINNLQLNIHRMYKQVEQRIPELVDIEFTKPRIEFEVGDFSTLKDGASLFRWFPDDALRYLNIASGLAIADEKTLEDLHKILQAINWSEFSNDLKKCNLETVFEKLNAGLAVLGVGLTSNALRAINYWLWSGHHGQLQPSISWLTIVEWSKFQAKQTPTRADYFDQGMVGRIWEQVKKYFSWDNRRTDYALIIHEQNQTRRRILEQSLLWGVQLNEYELESFACDQINVANVMESVQNHVNRFCCDDTLTPELGMCDKIKSGVNQVIHDLSISLEQLGLSLNIRGSSKLHGYALALITNNIQPMGLHLLTEPLRTWEASRPSEEARFLSQLASDCNRGTDEMMVRCIVDLCRTILAGITNNDLRTFYEQELRREKTFSRTELQSRTDSFLVSDNPDVVFRYIVSPEEVFDEEFDLIWKEFHKRKENELLWYYTNTGARLSTIIRYLQDINRSFRDVNFEFASSLPTECDHSKILENLAINESVAKSKWFEILIVTGCSETINIKDCIMLKPIFSLPRFDAPKGTLEKKVLNTICENFIKIFDHRSMLSEIIMSLQKLETEFTNFKAESLMRILPGLKSFYKSKTIGCIEKCPHCSRSCDVTNHGSNPGSPTDRHACNTGHQFNCMNGGHYEGTNKINFDNCDSNDNSTMYVRHGHVVTWYQLKAGAYGSGMEKWNYDTNPITRRINLGRYTKAWKKAGRKICRHFNLEYSEDFDNND